MRILIAHSFYRNPGGEDRYVRDQARLLSRHHTVEILGEDNRNLSQSISTAAKMTLSVRKNHEVRDRIEGYRPDVVHIHNIYPSLGPAVHLAARNAGVPIVMTVHNHRLRCPNGLMFTEDSVCRRCEGGMYFNAVAHRCFPSGAQALGYAEALWFHRFILRLEKKVALFLAPSSFMQTRLVQWGLDPERVRLIRHFVMTDANAAVEPGTYGIFAGRLSGEKGVEILIHALRLAGDPPFKLLGDGPMAGRIRELAGELGLSNLSILGLKTPDEARRLMAAARFAVVPSVSEEIAGLAALEAMSLGRPIVVSALGALPELASVGAGLLVRPGDPEDLAAKITALFADDRLCRRSGRAGLESARTLWSPEAHASSLEAAYSEAVELAGLS